MYAGALDMPMIRYQHVLSVADGVDLNPVPIMYLSTRTGFQRRLREDMSI